MFHQGGKIHFKHNNLSNLIVSFTDIKLKFGVAVAETHSQHLLSVILDEIVYRGVFNV